MVWQFTTFLALAGFVTVQLWWLRRTRIREMAMRTQLDTMMRKQATARAQVQAQQEAVFNSMVEGVVLLDGDGLIQLANLEFSRLFQLSEESCGQTLMEATRMHELADLVGSLNAEQPTQGRELRPPGLEERWLEVNAAAVFDAARGRRGSVVVFHDLTQLKKLERNREEFVANVSHELRTPLSLIKGYTETLLDGGRENPDVVVKFLQTIDRNAERLTLLIEDLLTISELESGRIHLQLQSVALVPLLGKLCEDFKPRAGGRGVRLVNEMPELLVTADINRVQQVFSNLVDNAVKYGRADGTVTIRGRMADNGMIEVSVADDGPGISVEALERVFERFYRVDKARSREQGGTGLGLAIVKHIVQNHGGRVWAKSEPGRGATFSFTLPKA